MATSRPGRRAGTMGQRRARDAPRSRPETHRSGVEAGVTAGVERNGTRTEGGVYQKQSGGCNTPTFQFPPSLLGFFVINRLPRTAPAERERTGATPLFSPLARLGVGGVYHVVYHAVSHPSPLAKRGRSRPKSSLLEGSPARTRAGRRAATRRLVLTDRRRHVLVVRVALAGSVPRRRSRGRSRALPHAQSLPGGRHLVLRRASCRRLYRGAGDDCRFSYLVR